MIDLRSGREVGFDAMIDDLAGARAVYVGEQHDRPHDHRVQRDVFAALVARDRAWALGLEMVQRPFQPTLERWTAGEIDEAALRQGVEWEERWGFDFAPYRPLFELARDRGLRVVALNAPRELTREVARGGLDGLSDSQRAALPELDLEVAAHRALVAEALEGHDGMTEERLQRFYEAQVVWDETMAEAVASEVAAGRRIVVLAGGMHVVRGLGIPSRAARRGAAPFRIVLPAVAGDEDGDTGGEGARPADYLVLDR